MSDTARYRRPSSVYGALLAVIVVTFCVVGFVLWLMRDAGCVNPFEADVANRVVVVEGTDGECYYQPVG